MVLQLPSVDKLCKFILWSVGNDHGARAVAEGAPIGGKGTTARTGTTTTAADRPVGTTGPGIV